MWRLFSHEDAVKLRKQYLDKGAQCYTETAKNAGPDSYIRSGLWNKVMSAAVYSSYTQKVYQCDNKLLVSQDGMLHHGHVNYGEENSSYYMTSTCDFARNDQGFA